MDKKNLEELRKLINVGLAQQTKSQDDKPDKLSANIDKRFDNVDERFNSVDKKFNSVNKRFDNIDNNIHTLKF